VVTGAGVVTRGAVEDVAADDLAVGALDLAGAVGVDGQGPAEFVQHHVMVPPTAILEVGEAGVAAVGAVGDVVEFALGGGLVAAAQLVAVHRATYFPNPHRRGSRDQYSALQAGRSLIRDLFQVSQGVASGG
jgi:hypothetical protein